MLADEPVPPVAAEPAGAARPGDDLPEVPAEGPAPALRQRPRRWPTTCAASSAASRSSARPAGRLERAAKWARRRPAAAVLLAAGLLMLAGVTGAAVWYVGDRARLRYEDELRDVEVQNRSREVNREANDALDQAELHLKDLHARLDDPLRVHELLSDIDRWQSMVEQARQAMSACPVGVCRERGTGRGRDAGPYQGGPGKAVERGSQLPAGQRHWTTSMTEAYTPIDDLRSRLGRATARYANFFSRLGVDIDQADRAHLESAITSSPIRFALVAGLDYWAGVTAVVNPQDPQLARLLELARAADPDPWRDRFRDPAVWSDRAALTALAGEVDVERQSPTILASLGWRLHVTGADSTALYKQAILYHPRDFWLHLNAANYAKEPGARVGLNLAACAIRPNSPMAYSNLSKSLREQGDLRGAVTAANRALAIDPNFVAAYVNLGVARAGKQGPAGGRRRLQEGHRTRPEVYCRPTCNLGVALRESKDLRGGRRRLQEGHRTRPEVRRGPHQPGARHCGKARTCRGPSPPTRRPSNSTRSPSRPTTTWGSALRDSKDLPGAVAASKKAIELDPKSVAAHSNLGIALLRQGDLAGAVAAIEEGHRTRPEVRRGPQQPGTSRC